MWTWTVCISLTMRMDDQPAEKGAAPARNGGGPRKGNNGPRGQRQGGNRGQGNQQQQGHRLLWSATRQCHG